jgi:transposase InsO family protein
MIPQLQAAVPDASIRQICAVLGISRSGYYASRQPRTPNGDDQLVAWMEPIARRFPGYGYRRITRALQRDGVIVNHKRVLRVMRERSLLAQVKRMVRTTQRNPGWRTTPNLVAGRRATGPNQIWVADLTYLHLAQQTGFLACVLDAWSRRCIGWAMGAELTTDLTERALEGAIAERQPSPGLIHHSDQGVQYANHRSANVLTRIGAQASLSAPGKPTQNAYIESFFSTLKREEVRINTYQDLADAERNIGHFIELIYNQERLHSRLGYLPPAEFELVASLDRHDEILSR